MNVTTLSDAELVSELLAPWALSEALPPQPCANSFESRSAASHDGALERKLHVAREIWLRNMRTKLTGTPVMNSPKAVKDWLCLYCAELHHEVFLVLYLDAKHRLIDVEELFRGTLTQTSVYPREVVKAALHRNAACVVLAHNHPSGDLTPSRSDELLTGTLKSSLMLVDVSVLDHFIVGGDQVLSFAEEGLM